MEACEDISEVIKKYLKDEEFMKCEQKQQVNRKNYWVLLKINLHTFVFQ